MGGYNVPTSKLYSNVSMGPGTFAIGVAGTTPTEDMGAIMEDSITIDLVDEKHDISQGNPRITWKRFSIAQGFNLNLSLLEHRWSSNLAYAVGAAITTDTASEETFAWGGQPINNEIAVLMTHQMATSGNTLLTKCWRMTSANGFAVPFTQTPHEFAVSLSALCEETDWAGGTLPIGARLVGVERIK